MHIYIYVYIDIQGLLEGLRFTRGESYEILSRVEVYDGKL